MTTTTNKIYVEPTVGGDVGTWGNELNTDIGQIDQNLGSNLPVTLTNANVTLTTGASGQYQNFSYTLSGTLTTNVQLIFPAVGGFYQIYNTCTGLFTVTAITSAGGSTGVVCQPGYTTSVWSDATNMYYTDSWAHNAAGSAGGWINKFRNGTMDVIQRGSNPIPSPSPTNINTATSTAGATMTMSLTVPAGALIVVFVVENSAGGIGTMSDATNGSYTSAQSLNFNAAADVGAIFYFANSASLSGVTLTYTKHSNGNSTAMTAMYMTGIQSASPIDSAVTATATGTSTTPSVTGGSPASKDEAVVAAAFYIGNSAFTESQGFRANPAAVSVSTTLSVGPGMFYAVAANTTAFTATLGASVAWGAIITAFKAVTPTGGAYTADGWIVVPTGAGVTPSITTGRSLTANSLLVTGATNCTDVIVKQRIESYMCAPLSGQTVTVQAQIFNGTGGNFTPTLTVKHPTAQDNYGATTTDVSAVNLQSCTNSAWTQVAYTFTAASQTNGLEVSFDFGNNFSTTGKSIQITECDIRVTPGVAVGINNSPPAPELRPVGVEYPLCQRYYWSSYQGDAPGAFSGVSAQSMVANGTVGANGSFLYGVTMRATPTTTFYSTVTGGFGRAADSTAGTDITATGQTGVSTTGIVSPFAGGGLTTGHVYAYYVTATSEL